jgi:hypothetical protein
MSNFSTFPACVYITARLPVVAESRDIAMRWNMQSWLQKPEDFIDASSPHCHRTVTGRCKLWRVNLLGLKSISRLISIIIRVIRAYRACSLIGGSDISVEKRAVRMRPVSEVNGYLINSSPTRPSGQLNSICRQLHNSCVIYSFCCTARRMFWKAKIQSEWIDA